MSFVKTITNLNGTTIIPQDMDTITARNNALNLALVPYDTIVLRNAAITSLNTTITSNMTSSLLPYDLITSRVSAISTAFSTFLNTANIYTNNNSFLNTIIRGSLCRSCLSINSNVTLSSTPLSNYFCVNGTTAIVITLSSSIDAGCQLLFRRGIGSTGSITISYPSIYPFNSNIAVSSIIITNSSDFVFFENAWYQKSNF